MLHIWSAICFPLKAAGNPRVQWVFLGSSWNLMRQRSAGEFYPSSRRSWRVDEGLDSGDLQSGFCRWGTRFRSVRGCLLKNLTHHSHVFLSLYPPIALYTPAHRRQSVSNLNSASFILHTPAWRAACDCAVSKYVFGSETVSTGKTHTNNYTHLADVVGLSLVIRWIFLTAAQCDVSQCFSVTDLFGVYSELPAVFSQRDLFVLRKTYKLCKDFWNCRKMIRHGYWFWYNLAQTFGDKKKHKRWDLWRPGAAELLWGTCSKSAP